MPKQPDKILRGLRRLQKRAKPGETFTHEAIAKACGVTENSIRTIETRAITRLQRAVIPLSRELY